MSFLSFAPCSSSPRLLCHARNFPAVHRSTILLPPPLPAPLAPCWLSPRPAPVLRVHLLDRGPHPTATGSYSNCFVARAGALLRDAGATAVVFAGSYGLVLTFDTLTQRKLIQQNSTSTEARFFASLVPLANCVRLVIYGFSLATDEGLIKSVTREGNPRELLRGPLYYVLILILCTLVFWRESPIGLIALAVMCGGDGKTPVLSILQTQLLFTFQLLISLQWPSGMADIIGRRFGSVKLPFNQQKSWAGSISMFVCGFLISIGLLHYYSILGYFQLDWARTMQMVAIISFVATVVESLPATEALDDNISVPLASIVAAYLSFCVYP